MKAAGVSAVTADERRLMDTAMADSGDAASAAVRGSGLGVVLLVLPALLHEGSATGAAVDGPAVSADERCPDTQQRDSSWATPSRPSRTPSR